MGAIAAIQQEADQPTRHLAYEPDLRTIVLSE
jgi:hypothetical protein